MSKVGGKRGGGEVGGWGREKEGKEREKEMEEYRTLEGDVYEGTREGVYCVLFKKNKVVYFGNCYLASTVLPMCTCVKLD